MPEDIFIVHYEVHLWDKEPVKEKYILNIYYWCYTNQAAELWGSLARLPLSLHDISIQNNTKTFTN